jgi:hypothetical protein
MDDRFDLLAVEIAAIGAGFSVAVPIASFAALGWQAASDPSTHCRARRSGWFSMSTAVCTS